ncbi:MAG: oligosaccharide flippase family protein [Deltaproteobacteria bacterium]|nr:MAG: oligosaccharide flippase family protein [Deltaproteobacteria bacterium]
MNFFRNVAGLLLTSAVLVPVGFLSSIVLARFLSVEDRGVYAAAVAFAQMVAILSELGWPGASIYRIRTVGSRPARVAAVGTLAILIISALVLLACGALEVFVIERFLAGASPTVFHLAIATIPFQLLIHVYGAIARGIDRFRLWNWSRIGLALGTLAAMTWVLVVRDGALIEALWAFLAVHCVVTLLFVAAVLRHTGLALGVDVSEILDGLRFGIQNHMQSLAGRVHERIDIFMIAYFLGDPSQLAFYAIAVSVVQRLNLLPASVATAAYPQMAGLRAEDAAHFACRTSRQSLVWVVLVACALAAFAQVLLPLFYGEDYRASVAPFLILLPGMVLLTIYTVLGQYFTAMDRQGVNIAIQAVSVVVNVLLNLWLIPRYGILGAAAASAASYALEATLITVAFAVSARRRPGEIFLLRLEDLDPYRRRARGLWRRLRSAR